jgi:ABC-type metal ion transport system substrate-binding protein
LTEEIDLTKETGSCGANAPAVVLMRKWLETGGNREIKVLATPGAQEDQVEMWAQAMKEQGVKIVSKEKVDGKVTYLIYLP